MDKWISVEERLPEYDKKILVCWNEEICTAHRDKTDADGEHWLDEAGDRFRGVTHWQPLPDPPADGGE